MDRVWTSENWGNTVPLVLDQDGNIVPHKVSKECHHKACFKLNNTQEVTVQSQPPLHAGSSRSSSPVDVLPGSQTMKQTPPASSGNKQDKRKMKTVCEKCFAGW